MSRATRKPRHPSQIDHESFVMRIEVARGLYEPLFPELFTNKDWPFGSESAFRRGLELSQEELRRCRAERRDRITLPSGRYVLRGADMTYEDALYEGQYRQVFDKAHDKDRTQHAPQQDQASTEPPFDWQNVEDVCLGTEFNSVDKSPIAAAHRIA